MRYAACALVAAALASVGVARPPAQWVTITGQVVFPADVAIPERKPADTGQDKKHCQKDGPVLDERVIVNPKNRGVQNVVVWLRPAGTDPKAEFAPEQVHPGDAKRKPADVVIEMKNCRYAPHIATARVGDTVVVRNSDPVAHNFFGSGQLETGVPNPKESEWRMPKPLKLEAPSVHQLKCTVHPWMQGYVRVFGHPYYAVTDADGKFVIANAPAGEVRIVYWHEEAGLKGGKDGRLGEKLVVADGRKGEMVLEPVTFNVAK